MKKQKSLKNNQATLYLVATPIGNLNEMTNRAIEVLNNVDYIAAEDTRNTGKLLKHFSINTKMIAHHSHNEKASTLGLLELLNNGNNIALVSDAGYPLIQDPGLNIVSKCIENQINVIPVSGANAALNALVASGLKCEPHLFYGFLNSNNSEANKQLETLKELPYTMVFYEAPHRYLKTLNKMLDIFGDRKICIARELTKLHEEFIRGYISEIIEEVKELKGELVIVVDGYQKEDNLELIMDLAINDINELIANGQSTSYAIKEISKKYQIKKNDLYNHYQKLYVN